MQHVVATLEWADEIRTLWRAQASFENMLIRVPPDWPPLYSVITWGWTRIAGMTLESLRVYSALWGVLGVALIYRAAGVFMRFTPLTSLPPLPRKREEGEQSPSPLAGRGWGGVTAAAVYAAAGYAVFAGVDARAYGMLLALGALALWLTLRWLARPSLGRSSAAAVSLALLFHTSYTSAAFIALLTLVVLVLRPRAIVRWLGVGVIALALALPVIPRFLDSAFGRVGDVMPQPPPPFLDAMLGVYTDFGGSVGFAAVFGLAAVLVIVGIGTAIGRTRQASPLQGRAGVLLLVWVLFPAVVYVVTDNNEFLKPRYMWWVLTGLALLVGVAALMLPRAVRIAALIGVLALAFIPVDFQNYRLAITASPPFRATFSWLAEHLRPGDVLVIDPDCTCGEPFGWDVFVRQYFPTGYLPIVDDPGDTRRVWYLSNTGWERDEALFARIADGRKESIFAGPWYFLVRLYEAPPLHDGVGFGGKVALHGVEIENDDTIMAKNDRFSVRLWWSAQTALDADYSISLAVLDGRGNLVAQADGAAQAPDTPASMTAWQPGVVYDDTRALQLPPDLPDGNYRLVVAVYQWWDGVRLVPDANPYFEPMGDGGTYLDLMHLRVTS